MPTLRVVSIAASGSNREEETVVVGLLAQMIDWCRKREGAPLY